MIDKEKFKAFCDEIESYTKNIMDFKGQFKPAHRDPNVDGLYLTIRCGLGGIYQMLNEFKDGHWQTRVADDSRTIAYSREIITLKNNYKDI